MLEIIVFKLVQVVLNHRAPCRVELDEDIVPGGWITYWEHTHVFDGVTTVDLRSSAPIRSRVRVVAVLPHPRIFDAHAFGFELSRYSAGVDLA